MTIWGTITEEGKLIIKNQKKVSEEIRTMKPGTVKLEVHYANQRSLPQNKYLHAILIPEFRKALNSVGYSEVKTDEQSKLIMKSMFLTTEIPNESGGKPVHYVKDTSDLTRIEMMELIEEVIRFTAENMNYSIPFPNEQLNAFE